MKDDLQKLRDELRSLEIQVAILSNTIMPKDSVDMDEGDTPHPASGKCQRCRSCKYMRMPHKSNPHYACTIRHSTIEPTWTCGQFSDKKTQIKSEPISYVGH